MTALPSHGELYHCLNGDQIRVLTIDASSSFNDRIACTLSPVSLTENPVYNALSYVWGDAQDPETIVVSGHEVKVTRNLLAILRHFRAYTGDLDVVRTTPVWIDAVCINQADLHEREQQVRFMHDIYRGAARVLSWIGAPDMFSDWAFDRLNDPAFRDGLQALKTTDRVLTPTESRVRDSIYRNIERRLYWKRLWILQEVALNREGPLLLCGTRCLPWGMYRIGLTSLPFGLYDAQVSERTEGTSGEPEVPWHGDYHVADAFTGSWRHFWTSHQNLAMGYMAVELSFSLAKFDAAPSWVIDLSRQPHCPDLVAGMSMDNWDPSFSADAGFDGDVLLFSGIEFDSVEEIGMTDIQMPWMVPDLTDEELAALRKIEEMVTKSREVYQADDEATAIFQDLRAAEPLWGTLTRKEYRSKLLPRALDSETQVPNYEKKLWDILMRREAIPQAWGAAYPTAIREDAAKLRAEVLGNMLRALRMSCDETRTWITRRGFLGVSARDVAPGDIVVLVPGMIIPFVLRPWQGGYRMVGFAYVAGLTDFDALDEVLRRSGLGKRVFRVY